MQKLTAPYKHSQNSPAEVIGATINKSLRILCADHSQWHKALCMVALAYRSTPTAGRNLSPFEIWFGRRMFVETDFSLLSAANIADIVPSHLDEVRLGLKVLQGLAIQNATENAQRHRLKYNQNATIPDYKLGNKVLLRIMATKPHQCAKLQFKYKGLYLIEQILPNYHYRLKELTSGKIMKNPVHADHLRHFNELETDNEHKGALQDICIFNGQTPLRHISVKVIIENIVSVNTDAVVLLLDRNFDGLFITSGDLNCPNRDWSCADAPSDGVQNICFDVMRSVGKVPMVNEETRGSHTLDVVFTNEPLILTDIIVDVPLVNSDHASACFCVLRPPAAIHDKKKNVRLNYRWEKRRLCWFECISANL
jgi:hypothetical protein